MFFKHKYFQNDNDYRQQKHKNADAVDAVHI